MMKFRLARPGYLIDINRIPGLSYIKEEDGYLKIGGLHAKPIWKTLRSFTRSTPLFSTPPA